MRTVFLIPLLFISFPGLAQTDSVVKLVNPSSISTPKGYSHAAVIDLGKSRMVLISGQVALDQQGKLVGKGDFTKQAEQVFLNIKNIVTELGGKMDHVVKFGMFILDTNNIQALRTIRDKYINVASPPASTLVEVKALFRPDILIEIEATAIIPKK